MFGYKMDFIDMTISDISNHVSLVSLTTRRKYSDIVFRYNLINSRLVVLSYYLKLVFDLPLLLLKTNLDFTFPLVLEIM